MKSKLFKAFGVVTTVAMLVGMLAIAPVLGISVPTVGVSPTTISASATYTIVFQITQALAAGDIIEVTFPTGSSVAPLTDAADGDVMVGASSGIGTAAYGLTASASTEPSTTILRIVVPAATGVGATLQVNITGAVNPATAGSYQLSVGTKTAALAVLEAAVQSGAYTIGVPVVLPTPGIIKVYNTAGILMAQTVGVDALKAAVEAAATGAGYTVELGPGLYVEGTPITIAAGGAKDGLIIKASGAMADTIVPVSWTVDAKNVTFQGLTLKSAGAADTTITVNGSGVKIDGCAFEKGGTAISAASQTIINYLNATAATTGTITNSTFDTTLGSVTDVAVYASGVGSLTVSKCTFTVDADLTPAEDYGVRISTMATLSENTFKGPSGVGVRSDATGTVTISKNTFSDMTRALYITAGTVDVTGNTVTGCGQAVSTSYPAGASGIFVMGGTRVSIVGNKITSSKSVIAAISSSAVAGITHIHLNDLSGNTLGLMHMSGAAHTIDLDATRNWWGVASGPTATQQTYYTTSALGVDASYYLGAAPSNAMVAFASASLDAKTTVGVVVNPAAAVAKIGVANYSANPGVTAPASTLKVVKYFEVFIADAGAPAVQVLFYGSINAFSAVYMYDSFSGGWVRVANQVANVGAGAVVTSLTAADLKATPFVLVEEPPAAPGGGSTASWMPALGAVDVPVDTTFTWPTVPGAVSYTFELAEETGQTDKFYLKDEVGSAAVNAYKLIDDLKYDTQYWWRVQSINSLGVKSAWTTSFFTTEKEPEEAPPPIVIEEQQPPVITLEIPPSTIQKVEPIPSYLLWLVIGVGAVLVIVVIVLIVRTRRIS